MLPFKRKDISFICLLTAVHFYSVTISLCSVSYIWCLWRLPVFFLLHSRLPHFPFILTCYCMKLGRADAEFLPLISRDFCAVLQREQPPPCCHCCYSALCCICRWDIFLRPAFPELGTWVESLVFVLSQRCFCLRPIFLLNTTCNCIFMWNSTMPLQTPCVGVYANDRTRNEPLVVLGFFGGFFSFTFLVFICFHWLIELQWVGSKHCQ